MGIIVDIWSKMMRKLEIYKYSRRFKYHNQSTNSFGNQLHFFNNISFLDFLQMYLSDIFHYHNWSQKSSKMINIPLLKDMSLLMCNIFDNVIFKLIMVIHTQAEFSRSTWCWLRCQLEKISTIMSKKYM